jgi:hypothetical protein
MWVKSKSAFYSDLLQTFKEKLLLLSQNKIYEIYHFKEIPSFIQSRFQETSFKVSQQYP